MKSTIILLRIEHVSSRAHSCLKMIISFPKAIASSLSHSKLNHLIVTMCNQQNHHVQEFRNMLFIKIYQTVQWFRFQLKKQGEFRDGFWKGFREKMRVSCFVLLDLQPSKTAPSIRSLQDSPLKTGSAVLQLTLRKAAGQERSLSTKANWMDLGAWHMAIPKYKGFLYCILLIKDYIRHW